jgi:hypothetical protein
MNSLLCNEEEKKFGVFFLILFTIITTTLTIFGLSPILNSIFSAALYTILITGIFVSASAIKDIGVRNFAGRSLFYFSIASFLSLINAISINLNLNFKLNEFVWIIVSILIMLGLFMMLYTYKLTLPKTIFLEVGLIFSVFVISLSLIAGWLQILNSLLITTAIVALRVSGKRTNCGIVFISTGLILLSLSNIIFIQRYWNDISFFGDISDLTLLVSWFSIVTGIYFIKRHHA